jgi:chromate transport protein ChrA
MLLPGPEAQQLATYILAGFYKTWAGILAGALLSFPPIFILWTLSYIYVANRPWVAAIFYGLKRAVLRERRGDDVEVAFRPSQELLAPWIKGSYI